MAKKVAVIQKPPVLLDREKTIARAVESIDEAAREGRVAAGLSRGLYPRLSDLDLATQAWRRHGAIQRAPRQAAPERR